MGAVPAVTAAADRVSGGRFGLIGSFVLGALVWRGAMWLIPIVGSVLYILAVGVGVGGWLMGAWEARSEEERSDLPALAAAPRPPAIPDDWEPPLAPLADSPEQVGEEE